MADVLASKRAGPPGLGSGEPGDRKYVFFIGFSLFLHCFLNWFSTLFFPLFVVHVRRKISQHGPNLAYLGPNLGQTGPNLAPQWHPQARFMEVLLALGAKMVPKLVQEGIGDRFWSNFGRF